jgi:endonuclease/exonuclease/phosphatase family metal-dependent hydrolase
MTFKLMSFNVRTAQANDGPNRWGLRKELALRVMREEDPDILGLQEPVAGQLHEIADGLPEYGFVGVGREDGEAGGEHAPLFYKRDRLRLLESGTFWLSETPDVPGSRSWGTACTRICTWGLFEADGRVLRVFNCHLDHVSEEARVNGAHLIACRLRPEEPTVVMGDMNAGERAAPVAQFEAAGLVDTFRAIHPQVPEPQTYHDFAPTGADGEKIDYVFVTADVKVLDAAVVQTIEGGRAPSDHCPVTATVDL